MELLQEGYHESGKLQYRQHGWGKAERKLGNNIYIKKYLYIFYTVSAFLY